MTTKRLLMDLTIAGVTLFAVYEVVKHVESKKDKEVKVSVNDETGELEVESDGQKVTTSMNEETGEVEVKSTNEKSVKNRIKKVASKLVNKIKSGAAKFRPFIAQFSDVFEILGYVTPAISFVAAILELKHAIGKGAPQKPSVLEVSYIPDTDMGEMRTNSPDIKEFIDWTIDNTAEGKLFASNPNRYIDYTVQEVAA